MSEHLHHKLAVLHENLLHGKLPRDLRWADALELVEHLGSVEPHGGEEFAFVVGAQREIFKRPHGAELEIEEVSRLRKFLKGVGAESTAAAENPASQPAKMVVVIDHHSAHVYQDLNGSRPEHESTITPYDPHHFHHHLIHRKESHYEGGRVPEDNAFYEAIVKSLVPATAIVLIGHGVGKSSAVDMLLAHLKAHRPDIAQRVQAVEKADLSALTEPEIEALAKRHMDPAA
jgi:hypothetical protein